MLIDASRMKSHHRKRKVGMLVTQRMHPVDRGEIDIRHEQAFDSRCFRLFDELFLFRIKILQIEVTMCIDQSRIMIDDA